MRQKILNSLAPLNRQRRCAACYVGAVENGVGTHMRWRSGQHLFLAIDQTCGIERSQLKSVAVRNGIGGARLNAVAAEDASIVVDVINLGVPLGSAYAVRFSVLRRFNINAV